MKKIISITETQLHNIVLEASKYLLNESATDRFIDKLIFSKLPERLKPYINTPINDIISQHPDLINTQALGTTEEQLNQLGGYPLKDFIRLSVSSMFDVGHGKGPKRYLRGIFRIVLDELNYLQHPNQNAIFSLKDDIMYIMQASENGSDPDAMKLDGNLNGLSSKQIHGMFKEKRKAFANGLRDRVVSMFKGGKSDYKVVPIMSHEDAVKFQEFTSWCITYDNSSNYDNYVQGGRRFYVFLKNGFHKVPKNRGKNCPLDEYGLSMISILVNMDGNIDIITTRWNHANDGEFSGPNEDTVAMFQRVIGMNLYEVCKPYNREELHAMGIVPFNEVQELLAQGKDPKEIFHAVWKIDNGYAQVQLNDKWNFIDDNNRLVSPDLWYDEVDDFYNGYSWVELNNKCNWIDTNCNFLWDRPFDEWFDDVGSFCDGYAWVELNNKCNWIDTNCNFLWDRPVDEWFDWVGNFNNGYAQVHLNNKCNLIDTNGNFLCNRPVDEWFDWVDNFEDGYAAVKLNKKWNWIDTNCNLLWNRPVNEWFDEIWDFKNGYAQVKLNKKWNFMDTNGNFIWNRPVDDWFDFVYNFKNGYASVKLGDKYKFIDTDGNLYDKDKNPITTN